VLGTGILLTVVIIASVRGVAAEQISGSARAVKGDTVILKGARVRLYGIEAPPPDEQCPGGDGAWPCGVESRAALAQLISGIQLQCEIRRKVGHGKWRATCLARGRDVALEQVLHGWARAVPGISDVYLRAESAARDADVGLWRGE
jgi:endonuclease YncB( thermonuclease family)